MLKSRADVADRLRDRDPFSITRSRAGAADVGRVVDTASGAGHGQQQDATITAVAYAPDADHISAEAAEIDRAFRVPFDNKPL
jgi:hypothetical protein